MKSDLNAKVWTRKLIVYEYAKVVTPDLEKSHARTEMDPSRSNKTQNSELISRIMVLPPCRVLAMASPIIKTLPFLLLLPSLSPPLLLPSEVDGTKSLHILNFLLLLSNLLYVLQLNTTDGAGNNSSKRARSRTIMPTLLRGISTT
jgi:hypothetical protein